MEYKYITEDNLENRQDYMYSEFAGIDFIKAYMESRQGYLTGVAYFDENGENRIHNTREDLLKLKGIMNSGSFEDGKEMLDGYVKRFEVSKRLFSEYTDKWKTTDNASYNRLDLYILLSECCLRAYEMSGCTKYFSCSLKINDTLLSVKRNMTQSERSAFASVLDKELNAFKKLSEELGVEAWN